ncbi:malto-oligosyltrehalose trehalohydrolase [Actinocrinis puniceicyclus]|uniref:Malto-oligosyltrehalose trehalohydrolase n=1 Tax=Actinocrinis puniceicyclus TaxID=977794 RepID=A0A8J7WJJ8_9ACTN|nr:malto-oligosyltrehalose trehalohydrolase [Actinocrinis puniceicyclus]MBS2963416.1 malto-oligosyltrehalose trehalohydrolase [Actinocrinis puniceicyclus]
MTFFEVWAPEAKQVELVLGERRVPMERSARGGWWELDEPSAGAGTDYVFSLDGGPARPDPRSRRQPHGVHGPSRVVEPGRLPWSDAAWSGRVAPGGVIYELHVGTFTAQGTFDAAIAKLDHLAQLGVDLVELMPVAAFPGRHGWGYDGVALWAVHEPYGGPAGLARFIDACHARGIGVLLDVVYNHLGPSGNYLGEFGPYFTGKHHTPWGAAVNLDDAGSDEVRAFVVGNALHWLRDFHLDGLRLDAVHALADTRAVHILEELAAAVDALAAQLGRPLLLIAETDLNDPRIITPRQHNGYGVHAQWDDDFHHALHALLTGERHGYYADFGSIAALAKTLTGAYFHDGTRSSFRGRSHGRPVDTALLGADRFVVFLQDHDQVGNRAGGDRIAAALSPGLLRVGAALLLTSPFTPMLFMGEEWGAGTPWQYFTDHQEPDLAAAVRDGRRREFARHGWEAGSVPDPQDPATFARSKLDWAEIAEAPHRALLDWHRRLIALRHSEPDLYDPGLARVRVAFDEAERWLVLTRGRIRVAVNLADAARSVPLDRPVESVLLASDEGAGAQQPHEERTAAVRSSGDSVRLPAESVAIVRVTAQ